MCQNVLGAVLIFDGVARYGPGEPNEEVSMWTEKERVRIRDRLCLDKG